MHILRSNLCQNTKFNSIRLSQLWQSYAILGAISQRIFWISQRIYQDSDLGIRQELGIKLRLLSIVEMIQRAVLLWLDSANV